VYRIPTVPDEGAVDVGAAVVVGATVPAGCVQPAVSSKRAIAISATAMIFIGFMS
jgi:hypothetical protein